MNVRWLDRKEKPHDLPTQRSPPPQLRPRRGVAVCYRRAADGWVMRRLSVGRIGVCVSKIKNEFHDEIGLGFSRYPSESWRDCVKRYGKKNGVEVECLNLFDASVAEGKMQTEAAFDALYEWDALDMYRGGEPA